MYSILLSERRRTHHPKNKIKVPGERETLNTRHLEAHVRGDAGFYYSLCGTAARLARNTTHGRLQTLLGYDDARISKPVTRDKLIQLFRMGRVQAHTTMARRSTQSLKVIRSMHSKSAAVK